MNKLAVAGLAVSTVVLPQFVLASYVVPDEPGQTAVWSYKGSRGGKTTPSWKADSNWEGGSAPDLTNVTATNLVIDLSATPTEAKRLQEIKDKVTDKYYGLQEIYYPATDNDSTGIYVNALVGGPWTQWSWFGTSTDYAMVIRDGSRYLGWLDIPFRERGTTDSFYLYPEPGGTTVVNRVSAAGGPGIKVPTGSHGQVKELFSPGLVWINRNSNSKCKLPAETKGTVEFCNRPGPMTDLYVSKGQVVLHGQDPDTPDTYAGEPAVRLDVTREDTFTLTKVGDEYFVDEWRDADGRTGKAAKFSDTSRPRRGTDPVTGDLVVNFGAFVSGATTNHTELGPSGGLRFSPAVQKAREIHVVFRDQFRGSPMPQLVGNSLSEWSRDWLRQDAFQLFSTGNFCDTPVLAGRVVYNGQTTYASAKPNAQFELNVVSSALNDHDGTVTYLGCASSGTWQGGACIAEILVYTNELTLAEREQTHRYLMRKWRSRDKIRDWGCITLATAETTLKVADGNLSVRELRLPAGTTTFTKTGAGTLEIGRISPSNVKIVVEEGDVSFTPSLKATPAASAPAANPTVWFDAANHAADIETYTDEAGKVRVAQWNARVRTNSNGDVYTLVTGAVADNYTFTNATLMTDCPRSGLAMVDFGPTNCMDTAHKACTNDATWGVFCRNGTKETTNDLRHREGFLVYLTTDTKATALSANYWTITKMYSNADKCLAVDSYSHNRIMSGYWTLDGEWINPSSCKNTKDTVHVVAFRGAAPLPVNSFFNDRNYGTGMGGGRIGEIVYYDRTLSEQERRDTELYLMNKWTGATVHPQDALAADAFSRIEYPAGKTASIAVDADETVTVETVVADRLTKTGDGTLAAGVAPDGIRSLEVRGGVLAVGGTLFTDAIFHADATKPQSMTYTVDADGVTNVSAWAGATALTKYGNNNYATRSPQLGTYPVNDTGRAMPFMDFGLKAGSSATAENMAKAASMSWPTFAAQQEFHIVMHDTKTTGDADADQLIIGSTWESGQEGSQWKHPFFRNGKAILAGDSYSLAVAKGYIGVNGEKKPYTTQLENGKTYLVTFAATNSYDGGLAFARRAHYNVGGQRVGECVVFASTNTAARRAAVEDYLMHKWFGRDVDVFGALWDLGAIACANGGTVAFTDKTTVKAQTLSGKGAVTFAAGGGLVGTTRLDFEFRGADDYDAIDVQGDFAVAPSGTANVTVALDVEGAKLARGADYTLLSASSFTGFANFADWTLNVTVTGTGAKRVVATLRAVEGRGLVLSLQSVGNVILIR